MVKRNFNIHEHNWHKTTIFPFFRNMQITAMVVLEDTTVFTVTYPRATVGASENGRFSTDCTICSHIKNTHRD